MAKLTPKQIAFADEYIINGGNATQAAIKAGYSEKTAGRIAGQNLKKLEIVNYIASKGAPRKHSNVIIIEECKDGWRVEYDTEPNERERKMLGLVFVRRGEL